MSIEITPVSESYVTTEPTSPGTSASIQLLTAAPKSSTNVAVIWSLLPGWIIVSLTGKSTVGRVPRSPAAVTVMTFWTVLPLPSSSVMVMSAEPVKVASAVNSSVASW